MSVLGAAEHWWGVSVHKMYVLFYIMKFSSLLVLHAIIHDLCKYSLTETREFSTVSNKLRTMRYGDAEYSRNKQQNLQRALRHHYEHSAHHPEHFKHGICEMSMINFIEMLIDWKASTKRSKGGDIYRSIEVSTNRFNVPDELAQIMCNTVRHL